MAAGRRQRTPPNRPRRGRTYVGIIRQTRRMTNLYPVPNGSGNYYLLFYSHFGVPTARLHSCLQYHIPKGMLFAMTLPVLFVTTLLIGNTRCLLICLLFG